MAETPQQPTVFDTDQQYLGDTYAKALLGLGQKTNQTETLIGELEDVVEVVNSLPRLKNVLESPRVAIDEKAKILTRSFEGRVSKDFLNFLKVVANKGRVDCLGAISVSARRMYDEQSGRVVAEVITAEAIDEGTRKQVAKQLAGVLGKEVELRPVVDPKIVGGMIVRVGDTVYDGSIVNQLERVRTQAIKRAADAIRSSIDQFIST